MVLELVWAALGGLLARLGDAKCAKRTALRRKKKNWTSTPRSRECQGRIEGGSRDIQGCTKCSAEAAGGGDKGRGPMAYKPNKPDDGKRFSEALKLI